MSVNNLAHGQSPTGDLSSTSKAGDDVLAGLSDPQKKMISFIFDKYDLDKDKFLNFSELKALSMDTEGNEMSKKQYKTICGSLSANHAKGLKLQHLAITYLTPDSDIEKDFTKLFPNSAAMIAVSRTVKQAEKARAAEQALKARNEGAHSMSKEDLQKLVAGAFDKCRDIADDIVREQVAADSESIFKARAEGREGTLPDFHAAEEVEEGGVSQSAAEESNPMSQAD
jgi:hypothetical protein